MAGIENAPPKGKSTIGGVKKEYVYAGVAVVGVLIAVVYYRSKSQATPAGAMVTDPAGNQCLALSPSSGYCPGTPEDLAYAGNTATGSLNSANQPTGQIIGYDQNGNPIYSGGSPITNTGPGTFTNNGQWSQAAQQYLIENDPNINPSTLGEALGAYINGQPVTSDQRAIIEMAIAFEGMPPVAGVNGNPPGIVDVPTPTKTVTVPNIIGKGLEAAYAQLKALGLTYNDQGGVPESTIRTVTTQSPKAGTKVAPGSKVSIGYKTTHEPTGSKKPPPKDNDKGGKPPSHQKTYTVVSGDTLSGIARRFGTSWQSLYANAHNRSVIGKNPNVIRPGEVLDVP